MAANENKVQFGLKNVHYSVYDTSAGTYGTPVAVAGAVSLDLSPEGELTKFYADNVVYYASNGNDGYTGDLEMARFPDQMLQDIWQYTLGTTSKVMTENANVEPKPFALMFQIDGDADEEYYVLYNITGARPGIGSKTNEGSKEPQTKSSSLTCSPRADGKVFARTTKDTPADTKTGWFSSVFVES